LFVVIGRVHWTPQTCRAGRHLYRLIDRR
jgi:hypothetical protein